MGQTRFSTLYVLLADGGVAVGGHDVCLGHALGGGQVGPHFLVSADKSTEEKRDKKQKGSPLTLGVFN